MTVDSDARTARSGLVDSGSEYEVEVRALTISYRATAYAPGGTITPIAAITVAAPSFISVVGAVGEATIQLRMPDAPFAYARLFSSSVSDFTGAVQVGADLVRGLGEVVEVVEGVLCPGRATIGLARTARAAALLS